MFSKAPWTTLAVMLSMASAMALALQTQDQIAARVGAQYAARRHHRRRVGLQDDRRPGDRLLERQQVAPIERRRQGLQNAVDPERARRGLDQRRRKAAAFGRTRCGDLRHSADASHADVDDLDRTVGKDVTVFGAVQLAEPGEYGGYRGLGPNAFGRRHA